MNPEGHKLADLTRSIVKLIRTGLRLRQPDVVDLDSASIYARGDLRSSPPDLRETFMVTPPDEVTQLLQDWRNGDQAALEKLTPLVYDELRRLANRYLRDEREGHTLQGTALVHEAYLKMVGYTDLQWQNRAHFFGVAARIMRQILIDHARKYQRGKREGAKHQLPLEAAAVFSAGRASSLVALDDALESLAVFDPIKSRIIELRYFGGLSIEEISEVEAISISTVRRHMRMAESWLRKEMSRE